MNSFNEERTVSLTAMEILALMAATKTIIEAADEADKVTDRITTLVSSQEKLIDCLDLPPEIRGRFIQLMATPSDQLSV